MSKDFDATLSEAIDLAADAAHTNGGATAARIRGRQRTMRKRITISATAVILVAAGTTAAAVQIAPSSRATPPTGRITVTKTSAGPTTAATSTAPTTPSAPRTSPSTATTPPTGSTRPTTNPSTGISTNPGAPMGTSPAGAASTTTSAAGTSAPFPGIWDITSWQQYREEQAAVEQGAQPWLLDPESVVQAWAAAQQFSSPTVVRLDTDTFRVTTSAGVVYTVSVTCPGAGSAAPIWVITHIS